jgi:hypothetical protein
MLCRLLLRLPGDMHAGRFQQTIHELVTEAARQAVDIRLDIVPVEAHDNDGLTLEARVLAQLLRHVGCQVGFHPGLQ